MGYFKLEKLLEKYNIDVSKRKVCLAINGERNIGKTTDMLDYFMLSGRVDENHKIGFIRNQDTQRETFVKDFNARMKNKFVIRGDWIYKLEKFVLEKKDGTVEINYKPTEHIGYCGAITTFLTLKSIESANIRYIVFDEYNEKSNIPDVYVKFINLFTTLERFNQIFFLMMGNRDTPNNEFMVKWEILPEKNKPTEDIVYKLRDDDKILHYFIELGTDQFSDLDNKGTLSYYLSSYDEKAFSYRDGGYADELHFRVVPFKKYIKPTFNVLWGFILNNNKIAFGEFMVEGKKRYACCMNKEAVEILENENYEIYAFDILGYQDGKSLPINMKIANEIITALLEVHRKQHLFFDSYTLLDDLSQRFITTQILYNQK